jgi:hypothetical protein
MGAKAHVDQEAAMSDKQSYSGGAVALTTFASIMLMIAGAFQFFAGIAALLKDEYFVIGEEYAFKFDATTWGWIHLLIGVILFLAGLALLQGAVWARTLVVIIASLSALANFIWLPYQPWWSVIIITLNVFIIWAITAHGRDIAKV